MTKRNGKPLKTPDSVRCAIYCRKSTDEGLDRDFSSIDCQREAGEAYIASQKHDAWVCLDQRYDDGGFSGGNINRPALQRLVADIECGNVDCVVVHRVDRLSRSLLDFARLMEVFDAHNVSFVSVTQLINTSSSMGRLMLNVLLSFAEFERELISERTRDKMSAARRKGKWVGGQPVLEYDVVDSKLVVHELEADRVREIFRLYLEHKSLLDVVRELNNRGWTTKRWVTKKEKVRGGNAFTKTSLSYLLKNVVYIGQVQFQGEVYDGEHEAIVDPDVFEQVQKLLVSHSRTATRGNSGAILAGLIRCQSCDCAMTHTHTARKGRRYRYYTCTAAQKRGYDVCPSPSVSAPEIERFVVDQIRQIGRDPALLRHTVAQVGERAEEQRQALQSESELVAAEVRRAHEELAQVSVQPGTAARMAEIQDQIDGHQRRLTEIRDQLEALEGERIEPEEIEQALAKFDPVWESLTPREQHRVLELLIDRIEFDGGAGEMTMTFHPSGIRTLLDQDHEEAA